MGSLVRTQISLASDFGLPVNFEDCLWGESFYEIIKKMFLYFFSFFYTEMTQVVEILFQERQGIIHPTVNTIAIEEPVHQQPQCWPGPHLNIKTVLSTYGNFHVKDKTAIRTSYL